MSTETTNKKIKIDNGTTFGRTYTDKAIDAKLPTDLIATANKLSLGVGNAPLGNGVNLDGFTYDEATKTLKAEGSGAKLPAGTSNDPFVLNYYHDHEYDGLIHHGNDNHTIVFKIKKYTHPLSLTFYPSQIQYYSQINGNNASFSFKISDKSFNSSELLLYTKRTKLHYTLDSSSSINSESTLYVPSLKRPETDGSYNLQINKTGQNYEYDWVAGGGSGVILRMW